METNSENEVKIYLVDMNGNELREGDLVMVQLEKPMLVGFITKIDEPSILTKEKRPGVMTVTGTVRLAFIPRQRQSMGQIAKLVDPRAKSFVAAIAEQVRSTRESEATHVNASGPTIVPDATVPNDPSSIAD